MQRNFELLRKILFFLENKEDCLLANDITIEGFGYEETSYHLRLLHDAGFIRGEPILSSSSDRLIKIMPFELTWNGHEFLDKIRHDTTWNRIKTQAKDKGLALSFNIIIELAERFAKDILNNFDLLQ